MRVIGAIVGLATCVAFAVGAYAWYAGDLQVETTNTANKSSIQVEFAKHRHP